MSAGGSGVRPEHPDHPGDPEDATGNGAPRPVTPAETSTDPAPVAARWEPADWDGLLARPPGLPDTSAVRGGNGSVGTGWPLPHHARSVLVAGARQQGAGESASPAAPPPLGAEPAGRAVEPTDRVVEPTAAPPAATPTPAPPAAPSEAAPSDTAPSEAAPSEPVASQETLKAPSPPDAGVEPAPDPETVVSGPPPAETGRRGLESWSLRRLVTVSTALVLVSVLTAYLASALQPTVYGAQADVLFQVPGSSQEADRQLATQEVLLGSRGVLAPVAERLDVPLRDLTRAQSVEQIAGSQVLRLQVRNQDPELAVRLAQGIADRYVESVSNEAVALTSDEERRIRDEIAELSVTAAAGRARLDEIAAARAAGDVTLSATQEERQLQVEDTTLAQRIGALQSQLSGILVERDSASPAEILTPAYLLDDPVGPRPLRAAAAGALLGIFLAAGLVALAARHRPGGLAS